MNLALIKRHPLLTGLGAIIGGLLIYALTRGGGSSTAAQTSGATSPNDLAMSQIAAATSIQQAQANAPIQVAGIQAEVADRQTDAQLEAFKIQTSADLEKSNNNNFLAYALAKLQSETNLSALQESDATTVTLAKETTQQQVNGENSRIQTAQIISNTELGVAGIQGDVAKASINAQRDVVLAQVGNQQQLAQDVITQAGKDKSRSSTGWAQIISALFGQGPQAIAANQPSEVASSPSSIISSVGGALTGAFDALFV